MQKSQRRSLHCFPLFVFLESRRSEDHITLARAPTVSEDRAHNGQPFFQQRRERHTTVNLDTARCLLLIAFFALAANVSGVETVRLELLFASPIEGIQEPSGLTIKDDKLYTVSDDVDDVIYELRVPPRVDQNDSQVTEAVIAIQLEREDYACATVVPVLEHSSQL